MKDLIDYSRETGTGPMGKLICLLVLTYLWMDMSLTSMLLSVYVKIRVNYLLVPIISF